MNIADKAALFNEIRRVPVAGATFGIYDMMRMGPGEVSYPVPWAVTSETSFLAEPQRYRELLTEAGLPVQVERDRRSFDIDAFRAMRARVAGADLPALGLHLVMGPDAGLKIANFADSLERAVLAPTEMVCLAR
jgi:hypothetical protein